MLRNSIDKKTFDELPADIKAEYKLTGDSYTLQHDEDVGALKRGKERVEQSLTDVKADRDTIKTQLDTLTKESAKTGSPAQIAADARAEALKEVQPKLERLTRLETRIVSDKLTTTAGELARTIGGDKNKIALLPSIERRLSVELDSEDNAVVVIKDGAGKPTKLTPNDLVKEFKDDVNFSSLVVKEVGSGGVGRPVGAKFQQVQSPGSGAAKTYGTMTREERTEHLRAEAAKVTVVQ